MCMRRLRTKHLAGNLQPDHLNLIENCGRAFHYWCGTNRTLRQLSINISIQQYFLTKKHRKDWCLVERMATLSSIAQRSTAIEHRYAEFRWYIKRSKLTLNKTSWRIAQFHWWEIRFWKRDQFHVTFISQSSPKHWTRTLLHPPTQFLSQLPSDEIVASLNSHLDLHICSEHLSNLSTSQNFLLIPLSFLNLNYLE